MNALSFNLGVFFLTIYPDTQAHLDGYAIITHTYSLYKNGEPFDSITIEQRASTQLLAENTDPDYFGQITFELPDKLFTYTAGLAGELSGDQVEQVIEFLSDVRSNPTLWANIDRL